MMTEIDFDAVERRIRLIGSDSVLAASFAARHPTLITAMSDLLAAAPVAGVPTTVATGEPKPVEPKKEQAREYRVAKGDTQVVVRIDRLARSLSHLLEVIERLEAKGAFFRSIEDPIDTASPQGKFTLQVLGAAAEFERALIRERTKAGLASARTKGRVGGNPGLRTAGPGIRGKPVPISPGSAGKPLHAVPCVHRCQRPLAGRRHSLRRRFSGGEGF